MGDFWPFWAKVAPNSGSLGHPVGRKVLEKKIPHPYYGATSEAIRRVYLGTRGTVHPKYTLWMASDLAPYRWGALFSNTLHWVPRDPPFGATLSPNGQKSPKKGVPPFWPLFQEGSRNPDPIFADFRKKVRIPPPRWTILQGGKSALFFENLRKQGLDFCYLYKTVFLEGGPPV